MARFARRNDGKDFEDYKRTVGYDKWESVVERFAPKNVAVPGLSEERRVRHNLIQVRAITCSMYNGKNDDLLEVVIDLVDNDIWPFEQFPRAIDETATPHFRQSGGRELHGFALDPIDHRERGTRIVSGDPIKDTIEIIARGGLERNFSCDS